MFPLLSLITFLPLIGGIVVLFLPRERLRVIRWTALGFAWADLMIVLGLVLGYSQAVPGFNAQSFPTDHCSNVCASQP